MGRRARRLAIPAALPLAALAVWRAIPSDAHACVTVTTYQAGQPSTSGPHCRPVLDEWVHTCGTVRQVELGYGGQVDACLPQPPVNASRRTGGRSPRAASNGPLGIPRE